MLKVEQRECVKDFQTILLFAFHQLSFSYPDSFPKYNALW